MQLCRHKPHSSLRTLAAAGSLILLAGALLAYLFPDHGALHDLFWTATTLCLAISLYYLQQKYRAAQHSAAHLKNLLDTTEDGFWLIDRSGKILDANRASAALLGYRVVELRGSYIEHYVATNTPSEIRARIASIIANEHERFEIQLKTQANQIIDIEMSCSYSPQTDTLVATFHNIGDRKAADSAIRDLSELNKLIIDNSESGIVLHKASGEIVIANKAAARIVGTSLETLMTHNFRKSRSWRESGELACAETALRTGESQVHDMKMRSIYGKDVWCLGYSSRLTMKGEPYLLTVFTDIMPIRQAEESMRLAKEKAEESLLRAIEAEEQIVGMSEEIQHRLGQELHDGLGQKLTGAALLCKALEGRLAALGLPESNDASRLVTQLNDAVNEARGIARGLFPIEFHQHGLVDALQKLADKVSDFSGMACTFDWDREPEISDEKAFNLYRIAQEAVNNAIKHSHGSEIVISLQCSTTGVIRLSVSDNGNGMPAACQHDGIGIRGMQFRARLIGAQLDIQGDAATGLEVNVTLPSPMEKSA